jgi:hypothetical protein
MKCGNSAFNAQGSRGIIVAVQVGAVKIYVAAVEGEALRTTERKTDRVKLMVFSVSFTPLECQSICFAVLFFFLNLTLFMTKLRVLVLSFPDFADNSIVLFYVRYFCHGSVSCNTWENRLE